MTKNRHEYWKARWEKQKSSSSKSDRSKYWKERWVREKSTKTQETEKSENKKPASKDRHRKGYYHDYNAAHHERLERGYTKGYVNGNVSEGRVKREPNYPDGCIQVLDNGYYIDRMGWKRHLNPITDALTIKEQEWHDDDWCESPFGD